LLNRTTKGSQDNNIKLYILQTNTFVAHGYIHIFFLDPFLKIKIFLVFKGTILNPRYIILISLNFKIFKLTFFFLYIIIFKIINNLI